jgi:hypothetical protein
MLEWLGRDGTALRNAFEATFGCEGRSFGSPSLHIGGVSDDSAGVQWNLAWDPRDGTQYLGVNLEGLQYVDWPVARLILNELESPQLLALRDLDTESRPVTAWWRRDYWQVASRPRIVEHNLGQTPIRLGQLTEEIWREALCAALACLDHQRSRRGRATQAVTLEASGRRVAGPVSPHLQLLYSAKGMAWNRFVAEGRNHLRPIHDWALRRSSSIIV